MNREPVAAWITAYERAWRSPGTGQLSGLFTADATYLASPWAEPLGGLEAIGAFWEARRSGPDEAFTMTAEIVAVDGDVAVVRAEVEYTSTSERWRDLWVLRFDPDGRCVEFEEWPFAPDRADGDG